MPCNSYALALILSAAVDFYICWHKYETPCLVETSPSPTQTNNKLSYFQLNIDHFGDITFGRKEQYGAASSLIPGCGFWSELEFSEASPVHVTPALAGLELSFSPDSADLAKYDQSSVTPPMSVLVWAWPLHYRKQGLHDPHVLWGFLSISWWL